MGYKNIADEHILAAKQDSTLDEMFVLQAKEGDPIDSKTLYEYYKEVKKAISSLVNQVKIVVPGRLLNKSE